MTYADLPAVTDVAGVARILQCHTDTVRHLIDTDQLGCVRLGRLIRVPRHAILDFLGATPPLTEKEVVGTSTADPAEYENAGPDPAGALEISTRVGGDSRG